MQDVRSFGPFRLPSSARFFRMVMCSLGCLACFSSAVLLAGGPFESAVETANPLSSVRTFMYQIQGLEEDGAVEALARSGYDMVVIEPTATIKESEEFDMREMAAKLHAGRKGRIVLAYIDVGQAEQYRTYWKPDWRPSNGQTAAHPKFLLGADPDGWNDSYVVAYWDEEWKQVIGKEIDRIMAAGFDGLYLDWVEAYADDGVIEAAKRQKVNPGAAMADFLAFVRKRAQSSKAGALIVAQNAASLIDLDARYPGLIDGAAFEDTWFAGKANAKWSSEKGGDIPNRYDGDSSTSVLLAQYMKYKRAGKPVFTVDYCVKLENAKLVYEKAKAAGLVPLVTRISLEKITETPPPDLVPEQQRRIRPRLFRTMPVPHTAE